MRVVFNLADRITVLGEGKMLAEGTPSRVSQSPIVQEAYLGRPNERADSRGLNTYYGKEPHPSRRRSDSCRGPDHDIAWKEWCRKSTTLRSLVGPDSATLRPGRVSARISPVRRHIASQPPALASSPKAAWVFANLTVDENLRVPIERPGPYNIDRVYQLFPRLGERRQNLGRQLSGGEQEMLSIGRALLLNRDLILDEPSQGLAFDRQGKCSVSSPRCAPRASPSCWWSRTCA
jgi:branched-chain amino acid transport system ATP-binding protein